MEFRIQRSPSMAEKPRKKRRPLHYLWSQRTPRSQTLDFVYESPFRSEEQRHLPMWNFDGMCYDLNGSRTRSPRQCQRNHRRLRLHFTMGYHQTCSQRQIPSSTISTYVYGKFSQRDNRRIRLKEVSIPEIMKRNKIPVLFIHGDADDYVPMWMTIKTTKPVQHQKNSISCQEQATHSHFLKIWKKENEESKFHK